MELGGPYKIAFNVYGEGENLGGLLVTVEGQEQTARLRLSLAAAADLGRGLLASAQALAQGRRNEEFEAESGPLLVRDTGEVFPSLKAYLDDYAARNPLRLVWEAVEGLKADSLIVAPFTDAERVLIAEVWDRFPVETQRYLLPHLGATFAEVAAEEGDDD